MSGSFLPMSLQLFALGDVECFAFELTSLPLRLILERSNFIVSLPAQFRDETRHSCGFINFSSCLHSASDSSLAVIYFSSLSAEVRAFLCLDFVKIFVHRAPHTGIKTFTIIAVIRDGNL
jgi:hypothetical protein